MAIGYLVLTLAYYKNSFNARDLVFMSTSLFGPDGSSYDQSAILTPDNRLDPTKLEQVGLPRYTATYVVSQMCYNFSLGAAIVHVLLWNWKELKRGKCFPTCAQSRVISSGSWLLAFGSLRFFKGDKDIDDPHYKGE